jgi:hypothetical protein
MMIAGPADSIVEQLIGFRELGFTSFNVVPAGADKMDQIERLGRDVLPALREAAVRGD